ncbi:GerAB/ArcD/ProY family transporter [Metabacillus arenae]|uniref:GerAB/ArcD/ProY family transporter n=1 Tax=Metabacillus arenae TaxID=2771434 RepID=A0A926NHE0_9BACI|nr:GerAB/ArcD/ProY family transporter [Metabacillus arenae]MBD1383504.1 GerAB/ArcD/ProY family transporter [Metabacillus arenae]
MEKISNYQLFGLTFLYQIGTTIIFGFGAGAGRDAWIAVLLSSLLGTCITIIYVLLMKMNPGLTLVQWFPAQFGKWLGTPISWLYPLIFLFDAGRVAGDLKELIPSTLLPTTPPLVFIGLFLLVMVFALYLGIENLARAGEILVPIVLILLSIEVLLLFSSDIIHLKYLLPILENGWVPIWENVYSQGISQTYGESIIFAMIWTQVKNPERIMKITIYSSILSGILLALSVTLAIATFGEDLYKRSIYPLFSLLGVVNVADFLNNLDPFGVIYLTSVAFFKMYIKIFAGIKAIQQLTHLHNHRVLIVPAVILVMYLGMSVSDNIAEHIYGMALEVVTPYVWVPLFFIFPSILLVVTWIRKKWLKGGGHSV